jgi:hypothetical protein
MTLDKMLQPGNKVHVFYNDNNINNQIRHIRAIVDEDQIVYRVWSKKGYWRYFVTGRYEFELKYENGVLTRG